MASTAKFSTSPSGMSAKLAVLLLYMDSERLCTGPPSQSPSRKDPLLQLQLVPPTEHSVSEQRQVFAWPGSVAHGAGTW